VVDSLTEKPEPADADLSMLNLKKKKLDLLIGK
jgi:hypothetical protein